MRKLTRRQFSTAIAATAIAVFYPLSAFSQVAAAFKDSSGNVFVYGLSPNSTVSIGIKGTGTRRIRASGCGVLVVHPSVSYPAQNFIVDGVAINISSISAVRDLPKDCTLTGYPSVFKTQTGALAIIGKTPSITYTIQYPNYSTNKIIAANACGFVKLHNSGSLSSVNVPTITGGRGEYAIALLQTSEAMRCVRNTIYTPVGWKPPTASSGNSTGTRSGTGSSTATTNGNAPATSNSTGGSSTSTSGTSSTTSTSATTMPTAAKSGNLLIVKNLSPGTYVVANAANPKQSKTYTVVKGCLVSDRTTIGTPSTLLISRQGLTFPVSWASLSEVSAAQVSLCN